MEPNKLAVISDIAGYGRCAMTMALPVISALKVQCCPVPTAILSTHTAYKGFFKDDYTLKMESYIQHWKNLNLSFNGILTGYLASPTQVEIVMDFIDFFKNEKTMVIVDPIMGDHGSVYASFTKDLCNTIGELAKKADVLIPNLTEACILTNTPYRCDGWNENNLEILCEKLGIPSIVISGIHRGDEIGNYIYENKKGTLLFTKSAGPDHHGTGDIFAAVIGAEMVKGKSLQEAVKRAASFIYRCIELSELNQIPEIEGVCFEECLLEI